ncbi:hypothetical protein AC790_03070 [Pantoea sp. RIT-PI-b]|nr:hypothetical protein AC790_03070 [Pantoea sp. RIT-PI-b]
MTICCSRCGCAKFFYTLSASEKVDLPHHHGACCAKCYKPLDLRDIVRKKTIPDEAVKSYAE